MIYLEEGGTWRMVIYQEDGDMEDGEVPHVVHITFRLFSERLENALKIRLKMLSRVTVP